MNLPNSLTILRIFFVPLLVVVLLSGTPNLVVWGVSINFAVWGVLILLAAATTDVAPQDSLSELRLGTAAQQAELRSEPEVWARA